MLDTQAIKTARQRDTPTAILHRPWLTLGAVVALTFGMLVAAHAAIPVSQRAVLENLYITTNGAQWFNHDGWNGAPGSECAWHGITCNSEGSAVIGINLADNGLHGVLPSLADLTDLKSLILGQEQPLQTASQSSAPPILLGESNELYGPIPPLNSLSKLENFTVLDASFSGGIPSLAGMGNLQYFQCLACGLSGSIGSLDGLHKLQYFQVSGSGLTGNLPALDGLSKLQFFAVAGKITGVLPQFKNMPDLQGVTIEGYRFSGGVPDLVDLPKLETFEVIGLVSGHLGTLSNLPSLRDFRVPGGLLTGSIPALEPLPSLVNFDVSKNHLSGAVPDLSGLPQLQTFNISYNQLSGSLPAPPPSLIAVAGSANYPSAVCPNQLTPAATPPSATDQQWSAITNTTPWSQACSPDPLWQTKVILSSSRNPSSVGQAVTFTAVVYGMDPTGTVTLTADNGLTDPPMAFCYQIPVVDGIATCTVADFPASKTSYAVRATYSGDANNAPDATNDISDILRQTVGFYPYTLTLSSNAIQTEQPVDLTLTYGAGNANDTVNFFDGDTALCTDVPVHKSRSQHYIAHCVTQFATPGPHLLMAKTLVNHADPIVVNVHAVKAFDADQFALTGPWYNPATSGQGLQFAVYPDHAGSGVATLVGGWFTYDDAGHQRWMAIQGDLTASHGASFALQVGESAGGDFNAEPVTPITLTGSATLTFYDCGHAALNYSLDDGRSGTIPYVRLDQSTACSSVAPAMPPTTLPANYADAAHSGAWYNKATSGQGFYLDLVPSMSSIFGLWYTYAPHAAADSGIARQRWFSLQANYTPGDLNVHDVAIIASSGGVFGQPSAVTAEQVGTANIVFSSCTQMTLTYSFDKGEFSGISGSIDEQVLAPNPACH